MEWSVCRQLYMDVQTVRPAVRADLHNSLPIQSALSRALWTSSGKGTHKIKPKNFSCSRNEAAAVFFTEFWKNMKCLNKSITTYDIRLLLEKRPSWGTAVAYVGYGKHIMSYQQKLLGCFFFFWSKSTEMVPSQWQPSCWTSNKLSQRDCAVLYSHCTKD